MLLFWFYFGQFFSLLNTKNASKLLKFVIYFLVQLSKFAKSAHAYPIFHSTKRQLQKFPARTICCLQNSYFLISVNICFSLFLPFGWFLLLILFLLSFDPLKKKKKFNYSKFKSIWVFIISFRFWFIPNWT